MEHLYVVPAKKNSHARLGVSQPETRNPRTGLPEQAYYRPPTPKNIQAAKNGLAIMLLGFLVALPFWFGVAQEWRQILSSIERTVAK